MKTLHNLIMARWQEDFGGIHNEQTMDAYTVSGFVRSILMDNEGEVQFKELPSACLHPFIDVKDDGKVVCSVCKEEETGEQEVTAALVISRVVHDCVPDVRHDIGPLVVHWLEKEGFQITRKQ